MGQGDRQRHQFGGLIAGVAEHHTLIAGTHILGAVGGRIHTHCDVRRLLMDGASNIDTFCVKPIFGPCIADFCNTAAGNLLKIWGCLAGDLAHDVHGSRFRCDLYCTPGFGIFVQQRIENTVRNKITDFVRMASVTDSEVKNFLIAHISCCIFSLTESSHFLLRWIRFSENRSVHAFVRAGIRGC